ncbi:DctP family TRAP transporter solute-binding subunit [Pelobacter seleniigenes]|uniref:DctP family TRAP transporter solute-binding subunit n=1 Tax=Pelobacter seleniigenes TaxID=407188 RepID=UPI0004A7724C|nr:DctP family TRAP transporter solute-binding subunit [Pelobacter seleniigenes]
MLKRVLFFLAVPLITTLPHLACAQDDVPVVMRISFTTSVTHNTHYWTPLEVLKEQVEKQSKGRLKIELHDRENWESNLETIRMVRNGAIQANTFTDGNLAAVYPPIQVFSIPYLFANRDIAWTVLDGPFGQKMIEDMAAKTGLRPLFWIENGGFRHFSNNKHAIHSPADMSGLRIRTMNSPLHVKIVNDLGAKGVPINWANVYEAIEAGIVDGQENSISTFLIPHLEKVQSYIVLDSHVYSIYTLLMNEAWYQALPDDLKRIIQRAKRPAAVANRGLSISNEIYNLNYLQSQGVTITIP